jgi:hypothetical protein
LGILTGNDLLGGKEMIKNKELSKKDNPFKYFGKLILIALFLIGISIVFLTYIIRVIFRI